MNGEKKYLLHRTWNKNGSEKKKKIDKIQPQQNA